MSHQRIKGGEHAMKKRFLIGAVLVSLLAGCAVGPQYRRPVVQPPAVFRGTAEPTPGPDPHSLADLQWFEVFKDEQLQALIRTALVANYDLRIAFERVNTGGAPPIDGRIGSTL